VYIPSSKLRGMLGCNARLERIADSRLDGGRVFF